MPQLSCQPAVWQRQTRRPILNRLFRLLFCLSTVTHFLILPLLFSCSPLTQPGSPNSTAQCMKAVVRPPFSSVTMVAPMDTAFQFLRATSVDQPMGRARNPVANHWTLCSPSGHHSLPYSRLTPLLTCSPTALRCPRIGFPHPPRHRYDCSSPHPRDKFARWGSAQSSP